MRASLFDMLGGKIDIESKKAEAPQHPAITPAERTPEVSDAANIDMSSMKFTHTLIKHLDKLYSKMLAGEVKEIASEPKYNPKEKVIEGQTSSMVLNEREAYYNPGKSAVTESF